MKNFNKIITLALWGNFLIDGFAFCRFEQYRFNIVHSGNKNF